MVPAAADVVVAVVVVFVLVELAVQRGDLDLALLPSGHIVFLNFIYKF